MQGIFRKENTDKALKYGIYRHLPTYEKIIRNLVSFFANKALNVSTIYLDSNKLLSYLKNIHEIRNITAHSNKFIGFKCKGNAQYLNELHSLYNIGNNDSKQDVFNVFVTMRIFLAPGNFATFNNSIRKRMVHLSKSINSINENEIFKKLGFPYDWYKLPPMNS